MKRMKRILATLTVLAMVVTSVPNALWTTAYAAEPNSGAADIRIADNLTLDTWKQYFGTDKNNFNTQYSGYVWTDKSVTKDAEAFGYVSELADSGNKIAINSEDQNNFLVSLSAMASSKSITGQDNKPTDTMIVLDISSSMYGGEYDPTSVSAMVESVNDTIQKLQTLNVNNRVGVTIYYGGPDLNQAPSNCYQLWLPLERYKHKDNEFLTVDVQDGKLISAGVNKGVTTESGKSVATATRVVPQISGTYVQQGILAALNQFMNADTVVPADAAVNAGEPRTPVMVLMSDGKPTAATNEYDKQDKAAVMGSNREDIRSADEIDFLTQLTAAYAKAKMDAHYETEIPLFYTLSLTEQISYPVMDPADSLGKTEQNPTNPKLSTPATVSGYWDKLIAAEKRISISALISQSSWDASKTTYEDFYVNKTTVDGKTFPSDKKQQLYVDKAFEAITASQLADAFDSIYQEIDLQTHAYPTYVDGDENLDGYISFVDKIGEYMNVTDVKGILMDSTWYSGKELAKNFEPGAGGGALGTTDNPTALGDELVWSIQQRLGIDTIAEVRNLIGQAYTAKQLYYDGETGKFSNYLGWYSDEQGNYLGFWNEGATTPPENATHKNKSYIYLGETDEGIGVKDSDMMYTTVRVREEISTGVESVSFAVPAALIPIVEFNISYNENDVLDSVTMDGADHPIRLVYEVALDDSVDAISLMDKVAPEYIAENTDEEGYVNFYTNQYEADQSVGYGKVNTYSYFRPSHQNENYYYQADATVYTDQSGTVYNGSEAPDKDGVYYREITVYSKDNGTIKEEKIYRQLSSAALETAAPNADGTWYIPKGNVHVNMDGYTVPKISNATETLENANSPYVDVKGHSVNDTNHNFVIGDTLGNNGKVRIKPETGIKLTKVIANADSDTNMSEVFEFTVVTDASVTGEHDAVKVAADGTETDTTVNFENGKATVQLIHGESLYILGLTPGQEFTVTETEEAAFVVSKVVMDGYIMSDTVARGTLYDGYIAEVMFTNVPRGEGSLTIAKQVEHPLGSDYQIPADKTFNVNVKMEGVAVSAGDVFAVTPGNGEDAYEVTLGDDKSFSLTFGHGEQVEIAGIPEGTKVSVTEENPGDAYTVTYKENGEAGDGVIESVQKAPDIDNITVVNTYEPAPVNVNIDLSGEKTLVDENDNPIDAAEWDETLNFEFKLQKAVYGEDGNVINWVDVATDTVSKTAGNVIEITLDRPLIFSEVGTYAYQVIETNHGQTIDGITYDAAVHSFNVVVTDEDFDGALEAEVVSGAGDNKFALDDEVWTNTEVDFVNKDNRGETSEQIMIRKELQNESGSTNVSLTGYQFELYETDYSYNITGASPVLITPATDAAGSTYVSLTYDYKDAGTHYYKLKEKATGINGMTDSAVDYNFNVVVTANNDGTVTSEVSDSFDTVTDENAGITYKLATFENVYDPADAEITLDVKKTLENRTLKAGEFSFLLKQGSKEIQTVKNDAAGNVVFDKLVFDKVGAYEYTVEETSASGNGVTVDETVYSVVITVTDVNGELKADVAVNGSNNTEMLFENKYQPDDEKLNLDGNKTLTGKEMSAGDFKFVLTDITDDKNPVEVATDTNDADGNFGFELTYDLDDVGKTYTYKLTEDNGGEKINGVTYDDSEYLITVAVGYDMDSGEFVINKAMEKQSGGNDPVEDMTIEFINDYEAAATTATITGVKELQGRDLEKNQFEFKLYAADEEWTKGSELQTKFNDAEGSFEFDLGEDVFKEAGTYRYIVDEVDAGAAGYTYDSKEVGAIVTVTDDLNGALHADVAYVDLNRAEDDTVTAVNAVTAKFDNQYEIKGNAEVDLEGTKTLTGRDLTEGEFKFVLTDITDKDNPVEAATATNDEDGKFAFKLTYGPEDVGNTYTYTLTEKRGGEVIDGVTYDDEEYKVVVKVSDDGKGGIATNVEVKNGLLNLFNAKAIGFENDYNTEKTSVSLKVDKQLTGRNLDDGEFSFRLVEIGTDGGEISGTEQTVTNGSGGIAESACFDAIEYTAPGIHTYEISEEKGSLGGVTYDETIIRVTVDVTDNGKGKLVAAIGEQNVSGQETTVGDFENIYEASGEFDLTIKKAFIGRDSVEGGWLDTDFFEFEISIADEATQAADAAGDIVFPDDDDNDIDLRIEKDTQDKEVTSPKIVINEEGTYKFSVHEKKGSISGVTYDARTYDVVAEAVDDGNGVIDIDWHVAGDEESGEQMLVFGNEYDTTQASIDLAVDKQFTGRQDDEWLETDKFTFELAAYDDPENEQDTASAVADGIVELPAETTLEVTDTNKAHANFGNIIFNEAGVYKFTVTEKASNIAGVSDDADPVRMVVINVEDDNDGRLVATKDVDASDDLIFTNTYSTTPVGMSMEFAKVMEGRDMTEGEFDFLLKDKDGNVVKELKNGAAKDGEKSKVTFATEDDYYSAPGVYEYTLNEVVPDEKLGGVTYDETVFDVIVTVTDNNDGTLSSAVTYSKGGQNVTKPAFKNDYEAAPVKVDFEGTKELTGRDLADGEFEFEIAAVTQDAPMPEDTRVRNDDGAFEFGKAEYTEAGTYEYTVSEVAGDLGGVTYDENAVTVIVTVTDNFDGTFSADVDYVKNNAAASGIEFTNVYEPEPIQISIDGEKQLGGRVMTDGEFSIQLKDDKGSVLETVPVGDNEKFEFSPIEYDEAGTYEYTVSEVQGDLNNVEYDKNVFNVTVKITDNLDGTLSSKVTRTVNDEDINLIKFYNTYKPTPVEIALEADKQLEGREWFSTDAFTFELAPEGGTEQAVTDGRVTIPSDKVTVDADNRKAEFEGIEFTKAGVYNFVITEKAGNTAAVNYDKHELHAVVTVTDDGKGTLTTNVKYNGSQTFVNTYTVEDSEPVQFNVIKKVDAEEGSDYKLAAGDFAFELKEGNKVLQTEANDAEGKVTFDEIIYDTVGVHTYTISEVAGNRGGITYDDKVYTVVVKVTDNGEGKLVTETTVDGEAVNNVTVDFNNKYEMTNTYIELAATKELTGRDWFDTDKFEFTLTPAEDTKQAVADGIVKLEKDEVVITGKTDNKTASFGNIEFEKPGIYNFVIKETEGDISGVTYDTHEATVQVLVTDNLDGTMSAVAAPTIVGPLTFTNTYEPEDITVSMAGTKILDGRDLSAEEFTFEIKAVTDGAPMPGVTTVKNAADGTVSFGAITYSKAGTYEYEITETKGDLAGITYDGSVIKATVKVSYDKATGLFSAEVSYEGTTDENGFVFNNEYKTKPVSIKLDADKKVVASEGNAYDLKAGDFKFELTPADSNPDSDPVDKAVVVENDAAGNVALGALEFSEAGDYTYTVKEISSGIAGMSYDDTVYTITVKVTDNEAKAQLEAVTEITAAGKTAEDIVFENRYDPAETSVNFDGKKVLESEHKDLAADEFTFQLKDADGNVIDTATNSAAGTFQFGSITYDREGTYEYTVSETNDGKAGYTYDDTVYEITVVVTDENGALKADVTGGTAADIVFTNGYEPAPEDLVIKGHKALTGRDLAAGEFEFAVLDGEKEVATAANNADGSFTFSALNFTKAGTYNYTIVEKNTSVAGVTYDQIVYGVTVKVVDKDGVLEVESADYLQNGKAAESITFSNTYKPAPTSIQLGAAKVLEGRDLTEGEFKFVLEDESGNKLYAENTADGKIIFDEIDYDAAGTYTYKLYEESGDEKHMIYDETVYDITVTVKDDLAGNLKATIEGLDDGAVFKNVYAPEDPTEPEQPTKPMDETSDGGTQTGDDFNAGLYGFLALAALAVAGAAVRRRKAE